MRWLPVGSNVQKYCDLLTKRFFVRCQMEKTGRGEELWALRNAYGFTQRHLSELSGVSVTTISGIENGRNKPSEKTIRKLMSVLELEERLGKNSSLEQYAETGLINIIKDLMSNMSEGVCISDLNFKVLDHGDYEILTMVLKRNDQKEQRGEYAIIRCEKFFNRQKVILQGNRSGNGDRERKAENGTDLVSDILNMMIKAGFRISRKG